MTTLKPQGPAPLTPERLQEIRRREQATIPGPWVVGDEGLIHTPANGDPVVYTPEEIEARRQFIAHARQDVPDLVAEVERLRAENARMRDLATPPPRIVDLAKRLVAAGEKAEHVSASETHEISDWILERADLSRETSSGEARGDAYGQGQEKVLADVAKMLGIALSRPAAVDEVEAFITALQAEHGAMRETLATLDGWLANTGHGSDHPWRIRIREVLVPRSKAVAATDPAARPYRRRHPWSVARREEE